ncbi:hypothetical protein DPMN_078299 [Dreissena polymorpha]|uniref:Secreted protein n=1 Tax=Dreissena polymorpha TaxID=45954 RepID=A0A9D3YM05_DREPO|nr:hypothetical protein DPMN_078299 [Dreissena polymorpha]
MNLLVEYVLLFFTYKALEGETEREWGRVSVEIMHCRLAEAPSGGRAQLVLTCYSTLTSGSRTFTHAHPCNRFCWWAKRGKCSGMFQTIICKLLERRRAPRRFTQAIWTEIATKGQFLGT